MGTKRIATVQPIDLNAAKKSEFSFYIREDVSELVKKMRAPNDVWYIASDKEEDEDYTSFELVDEYFGCKSGGAAFVRVCCERSLYIKTAWSGFEYEIDDDEEGALVQFSGPLNALLNQNLLPSMTYIPGTLTGRYMDMPEHVSIEEFCKIRQERHSSRPNNQDGYGGNINKKFNNEIPALPLWEERINSVEE